MVTHVISERNSGAGKLQKKTIATSFLAVALAIVFGYVLRLVTALAGIETGGLTVTGYTKEDLPRLISSLIPSDIIEPFKMLSPYPMIILSFLIVIALGSVDNQFDRLKNAVDAFYVLFSKMLNLVMLVLPFFCFLSFLHLMLESGFRELIGVIVSWALVLFGVIILLCLYALRLKAAGVKVIDFIKKVLPVLKENIMINSAIDAVPFNIRQCGKIFKINRTELEDKMPVLAQINLDGNCFIIMAITMLLLVSGGAQLPWWNYLLLAVLVVFLSVGAPNQPGSILIGMLIIIQYLNIPGILYVAIYCEVLLGTVQNLVNVTGDIVMVVIENNTKYKQAGTRPGVSEE